MAKATKVPKPGKSSDVPEPYRPISLLPTLFKVFEKLYLVRLQDKTSELSIVPDHQFDFRPHHSTVEQVHQDKLLKPSNSLQLHVGLLHKIREALSAQHIIILSSHLRAQFFQMHYGEATSAWKPKKPGKCSGPDLYLLYTADVPRLANTTIATSPDDTSIVLSH